MKENLAVAPRLRSYKGRMSKAPIKASNRNKLEMVNNQIEVNCRKVKIAEK